MQVILVQAKITILSCFLGRRVLLPFFHPTNNLCSLCSLSSKCDMTVSVVLDFAVSLACHSSILAWRIPRKEEPGGATVYGVIKELDTT